MGEREVADPGSRVPLLQLDGRVRQDDGLAGAGIALDPVPPGRLGGAFADHLTLSGAEVFEGDEPVHGDGQRLFGICRLASLGRLPPLQSWFLEQIIQETYD